MVGTFIVRSFRERILESGFLSEISIGSVKVLNLSSYQNARHSLLHLGSTLSDSFNSLRRERFLSTFFKNSWKLNTFDRFWNECDLFSPVEDGYEVKFGLGFPSRLPSNFSLASRVLGKIFKKEQNIGFLKILSTFSPLSQKPAQKTK